MSTPHPSRAVNHTELKPKGTLKFRGYPMKRTEISPFAKVMSSNGMGEEKINAGETMLACVVCSKSVPLRKATHRPHGADKDGWVCHACKKEPYGFAW